MMDTQQPAPRVSANVQGLVQVAISVTDLARSKSFYVDQLGMRALFDTPELAFLMAADTRVMLSKADTPIVSSSLLTYFKVDDIHASCHFLQASGATLVGTPQLIGRMEKHDVWIAFVLDPDAHQIGLMCEIERGEPTTVAA